MFGFCLTMCLFLLSVRFAVRIRKCATVDGLLRPSKHQLFFLQPTDVAVARHGQVAESFIIHLKINATEFEV
jgi:hypothetical protein